MAERRRDEPAKSAVSDAPPAVETPPAARAAPRPGRVAVAIYAVCTIVYAIFAAERLRTHSPDNHFSYLADSFLHRTLAVRCPPAEIARNACPPGGGGNDWARYCRTDVNRATGETRQNCRWFVAFPSFPAVVYMPFVAMFGRDFPNRALDVALGGLAPALLYLLLERLSRAGRSKRSWRENVGFSALFAFGTVYFFSAVQGSVWFTAHVVGASLMVGYVACALDAERPLLAGVLLGMALHTRASMVYASVLFGLEALRVARMPDAVKPADDASVAARALAFVQGVDWRRLIRLGVVFSLPIVAALALKALQNKLSFDDPTEVGYRYLQVRWRDRIDRWGLFNYHYLARNLGIAFTSLPWFSRTFPYIVISLHGIALWVTTPHYLELVRLRRRPDDRYTPSLAIAASLLAMTVLLYQNSGWVQFGFRFSNDFAVLLIVLLAINGRRIGKLWIAALAVAIAVNAFGAWSFDRQIRIRGRTVSFYDNDFSQQRYFQPD